MLNRYFSTHSFVAACLVLFLAASTVGCDSVDANEDQEANFQVSTITVPLEGGQEGLQFFVTPTADVVLVKVTIKSPITQLPPINAGSTTIIKDQSFGLQGDNEAYVKVSGTWTFTFEGSLASGSRKSFTKTATVNVGA